MKVIKPSIEILTPFDFMVEQLKIIELAGRNCYKSEDKICEGSYNKMIGMLRTLKHESVMEHASITVRMIGSRAMSHQLVRHRIAAYSQESQRYCNYGKGKFGSQITFIEPIGFDSWSETARLNFTKGLESSEQFYLQSIQDGVKAEDARGLLPNQVKTEVVVTMNLRSWRHFLKLRCDKHSQSEIRFLAKEILKAFHMEMPIVFKDLADEFLEGV